MSPERVSVGKTENVAVIGNSNSITVTSYARILGAMPGIKLSNHSIGGVTNIVLLSFLTDDTIDLSQFDTLIVELSVIEIHQLYSGSGYTAERSRDTFDLFMMELKARSTAKVVVVILPTLFALLDPQRYFGEQHVLTCARKHGVAVLNFYHILRELGHLEPGGPPPDLVKAVDGFVDAFQLPPSSRYSTLWKMWLRQDPHELNSVHIGTSAFAEQALEDPLHLSRASHAVVAELLYGWIGRTNVQTLRTPRAVSADRLVMRASPRASDPMVASVDRMSSLITRSLTPMTAGSQVSYACPPGYIVLGILLNECRTSGILSFDSPLGRCDIRAQNLRPESSWNALILLLPGNVGDGDITVTISGTPPAPVLAGAGSQQPRQRDPESQGVGELGEIYLARRDWRRGHEEWLDTAAAPVYKNIEDEEWALEIIRHYAKVVAASYDGIKRGSVVIDRSVFDGIMKKMNSAAVTTCPGGVEARLWAVSGNFPAARAVISESIKNDPGDPRLEKMSIALSNLDQAARMSSTQRRARQN